ncbi:MAG: two pore domain potassium channel family protein [Gammaproteobacteria bacterium]|jgi:hypothetical protein|nr:two pore domain potassium channel family protein [Gammaproteobacteria bacterium]
MPKPFKENHFIWLTLALIGLLISGAISREISNNLTLQLFELSSIALLMISLLSFKTSHIWIKGFVIIVAIMLATVVVRSATKIPAFEYFYLGLMLAFFLGAAWLVASQVLLTGSVDFNKIVGAVALYLMLGLIWSIFYVILLEFSPQALKGIEAGNWYDNLPSTTYFSFVTLTTLGYGDISPVKPIAEVLVILEAVVGMLYLAVIVASLVGSYRDTR